MRSILLHTSATRRVAGAVLLALAGETLTVSEHDEAGDVVEHGEIDLADAEALVERGGAEWIEDADEAEQDSGEVQTGAPASPPKAPRGRKSA